MFCPLRYIGNCAVQETRPQEALCLQSQCALWHVPSQSCCLASIAALPLVADHLLLQRSQGG